MKRRRITTGCIIFLAGLWGGAYSLNHIDPAYEFAYLLTAFLTCFGGYIMVQEAVIGGGTR